MHTVDVQHIRTKNASRLASKALMNQPPGIGSWRVGGLGGARQPGVAMRGKGSEQDLKTSPLHHQFESILFIFSSAMRMAENRALRASIHASYITDSDPEGMKSQLCENGLS